MSADPRFAAAIAAADKDIEAYGAVTPGKFPELLYGPGAGMAEDIVKSVLKAYAEAATITTREQFEALPRGTVVRDYIGQVAERQEDFWANTLSGRDRVAVISFPARVIHWGTE